MTDHVAENLAAACAELMSVVKYGLNWAPSDVILLRAKILAHRAIRLGRDAYIETLACRIMGWMSRAFAAESDSELRETFLGCAREDTYRLWRYVIWEYQGTQPIQNSK